MNADHGTNVVHCDPQDSAEDAVLARHRLALDDVLHYFETYPCPICSEGCSMTILQKLSEKV